MTAPPEDKIVKVHLFERSTKTGNWFDGGILDVDFAMYVVQRLPPEVWVKAVFQDKSPESVEGYRDALYWALCKRSNNSLFRFLATSKHKAMCPLCGPIPDEYLDCPFCPTGREPRKREAESEHVRRYHELLADLRKARAEGPLSEDEEVRHADELDGCWRQMTAEEREAARRERVKEGGP